MRFVCLTALALCIVLSEGYNLPIDERARIEAEADCKEKMLQIQEIYENADKGMASNAVIGKETAGRMRLLLQETECPVIAADFHYNMANYEKMDQFLKESLAGNNGEIVAYEIHTDGGISRKQFLFDGRDMYVLRTTAVWNEKNRPGISFNTRTRLKRWSYTEKGFFSYTYCVPESPDVSEAPNGNALIRVKPQEERNIGLAEKWLIPIGYQGNNLLCSNWDAGHLENLDYNGLFEYLYALEYGESMDRADYVNGIPGRELEALLTRYLPVAEDQLRQYAVYDVKNETYPWARLGCGNYAPNAFGTAYPEITDIRENEDGTITLAVDAVCERLGSDAVMSHLLTLRFLENGSVQYLGNSILDDGLEKIPAYQYRVS